MRIQTPVTRRRFVQFAAVAGAATLTGPLAVAQVPMTARQIVEIIKARIGVPWDETAYRDTFKMGDPDTPVTGVASTFMSTLDVIEQASRAGLNFVITHEPTVWSDPDTLSPAVLADPLYAHKKAFVDQNRMVIWRIHDHWHARRPEPMSIAQDKLLGWEQYVVPGTRSVYKLPPTPLKTLAQHMAGRLDSRSIRMVGDPEMIVTMLGRGGHGLVNNVEGLAAAGVDAIATSEAREVDSIEYVRDLSLSGKKKGMILIAHQAGEEAGMTLFTEWLPTIIAGIKVANIKTTDQMWIA